MKISKDEVKHLAELSNISLSDEDMESLRHDLANILGYIEQLSELDTTGVDPTYQVSANQNTWREDEIDNYGVELVTINTMESIDGNVSNSNENYVTIMNNNLELFNKELYK